MTDIRKFMQEQNLQYLIVNTTNEFLVEYNTLEENSVYKLTNFSGSTAHALVTPETIYLFVDGRYHIQADLEVDHNVVTVVKLQSGVKLIDELIKLLPESETLGIFAKKHSIKNYRNLAKHFTIKILDNDPFDNDNSTKLEPYLTLDKELTGMTIEQKLSALVEKSELGDKEVIYLTNLDDVSYFFNKRNYYVPYSAKIKAKALIFKDKALLFTPDKFEELELFLKTNEKYKILIDPSTINLYDAKLIKQGEGLFFELETNPVQQMRSIKNETEIEQLKDAFARTDKALSAVRDYIYSNDNISEYDIDKKLREEFFKQGAVGLSFKPIIAKDDNSALAHYSKSSKDEIISDGSLVLIDCGAYFESGLATDITRVFVKGKPSALQKRIYTIVLKAFLKGYNYSKTHKEKITGFKIDNCIREFMEDWNYDGFVFNHGLGHGIGINVHEYPPNLSNGTIAKVEIQDGMCFTIEPGLYKQGEFGVRLENSCYMKDGQIHSFVKMNYEDKLINYEMLTPREKEWLKEFEVK